MKSTSKNQINLLLKKQVCENFSRYKKNFKSFDILGFLLNILIACFIGAMIILVFYKFTENYFAIEINDVHNIIARQFELLTIVYGLAILISVMVAVGAINYSLFENEDLKILIALPLAAKNIVASKVLVLYIKQVMSSIVTVLPFSIMVGMIAHQTAYFYVMSVLACFILPIFTIVLATFIALPYYLLKKFIGNKYMLNFLIISALVASVFLCYSKLLELLQKILIGSEIRYFFDENMMTAIISITSKLYPANLFTNIVLRLNFMPSFFILIGILLVAMVLTKFVISKLYYIASKEKLSDKSSNKVLIPVKMRAKHQFNALLYREFNMIFRTPSYAFQYFSVALTMPLMVYLCMRIGSSFLEELILVNCNFELSIILVVMFEILTNTFCATNISRDGTMFYSIKAMPISYKKLIYSKIIFCFIISVLSIVICGVVLVLTKQILAWQGLYVVVVACVFSFAEICFATRLDFNCPIFSIDDDGEIRESNKTISTVIFVGLLFASILGFLMLYFAVYLGVLKNYKNYLNIALLSCAGISIIALGLSLLFLNCNLKTKYYNFNEGDL